jgi:hypothetical protein
MFHVKHFRHAFVVKYFTAEILMKDFTVDNETARVLRPRAHLPFSDAHLNRDFWNCGSLPLVWFRSRLLSVRGQSFPAGGIKFARDYHLTDVSVTHSLVFVTTFRKGHSA